MPRKKVIPGELPELISLTIVPEPGNLWKGLKIHSRGKEIMKVEEGEANIKESVVQPFIDVITGRERSLDA
jgi:hypothetical protein